MLRHPFPAIDFAPQIKMPALVILSEFDEIIPIETGRRLGEALGGSKEIITLPMGHMDINEHPGYFGAINAFVNEPARSTSH
jgi:pimeloyl-ACP methyl ester carboxylesterase